MDDTTWYFNNRTNMQKILDKSSEFLNINDISANNEKSTLICINTTPSDRISRISFTNIQILSQNKHESIRILGVWISESGNKKFQKNIITNKINNTINILKWKKITDKQFRYIINQVLFPAIEYLLNNMILSENECDILNSKILQTFKNKNNLPTTTPNCILFSDFGYKLFNIWNRQLLLHGSNLQNRINNHNLCNNTTMIRLQQLQNQYWSHTSILEDKLPFHTKKNSNLTNDILNILKIQGITFQLS